MSIERGALIIEKTLDMDLNGVKITSALLLDKLVKFNYSEIPIE